MPAVHETGVVSTWGRWAKKGSARIGSSGYGCAEQPWARVTVEPPGAPPRTVRVLSAHLAPLNGGLKTTALGQLAQTVTQMQVERPGERIVMGGDLNQTRCRSKDGIETANCAVRAGPVITSGFDRCYLAFWVKQHTCGSRAVFPTKRPSLRCHKKSLTGRGHCTKAAFRRYYSDHPVLHATLG